MRKYYSRFCLFLALLTLSNLVMAQAWPTCPPNITVNNTTGQCGTVVNYRAPALPTTVNDTFRFTGARQTFTVPAGVSSVTVKAWGAQGGGSPQCLIGGWGGYAEGILAVSAGSILHVYVGGYPGATPRDVIYPGGFNGGGSATTLSGAGGGASDVRTGDTSLTSRVIVAGGGGGANQSTGCYGGGAGGGTSGTMGVSDGDFALAGGGGTQSEGGAAGTNRFGVFSQAGSFGQGGNANTTSASDPYLTGGGGGYYGGGSSYRAAGGGGSGYVGGVTNGSMQTGVNSGNGMVVISYEVPGSFTVVQTDGQASGKTFQVGTTTNAFVLRDGQGNTISNCSFTVTVNDIEAPAFTAPANSAIPLSANCSITIPNLLTGLSGSDNCGTATFTQSPAPGTIVNSGHNQTTTVSLSAHDSHGNISSKNVILTANDQTLPTITAPAALNVNADAGKCYATITNPGTPVGADNCTVQSITNNAPTNGQYPVGSTTVTYTVKDAAGNQATATQTITVTDNQKPALTCPASQLFCYNSTGIYNLSALSATDNCGIQGTGYVVSGATTRSGSGNNAGSQFNPGVSTIKWTVTDVHGNQNTCETTVTINNQILVTIPDSKALNSNGVAANTAYVGYAPASSITLTANASGGSGNYTYLWSNGKTTRFIAISPTSSTTYTVTVSDGKNCTATANKTIKVVNVRCGNKLDKVSVCHHGSTICIDKGFVADHLNHGDNLGNCQGAGAIASAAAKVAISGPAEQLLSTTGVYPNPTHGAITVQLQNVKAGIAQVVIVDVKGSVVQRRQVTLLEGRQTIQMNLQGNTSGLYLVKVFDGKSTQVFKVYLQQ